NANELAFEFYHGTLLAFPLAPYAFALGISLTVVDVGDDFFTVALIPHTLEVTTLGTRKVGDIVNLETDLLAKYVQRSLEHRSDT
ncbi:MAG: hypothetical protein ACF787_13395, partial [Rhodopirellula sp. JB053]